MTAVDTTADNATSAGKLTAAARDSVKTVIAASMVGTAIEFYDFYAYGTAAANSFPTVFFSDTTNPTVALLLSLVTFAVAFIARPVGSLIFGHFGDRLGRKKTLVVSLMTMGVATFLIGTQGTVSWEGVLFDVGNDYVTIYQEPRDRYIVCDIYSLKYMEFYDTRRRELCNELLRREGQNRW